MSSSIFETVKRIFQKLKDLIEYRYLPLSNETDDTIKISKRMFLTIWYNMIFYYVGISIINPYAPTSNTVYFVVVCCVQIFILRIRNYKFMAIFFIIGSLISIFTASFDENDALRLLGVALVHHNYFLVLPDHLLLRGAYVTISFLIVVKPGAHLFALIEDGNIAKLEVIIKNFYFTFPLLYLVNHFTVTFLVKAYQKSLQAYKDVQKELATANDQLKNANEKLKETLSLLEKTNKDLEASLKARELFIATVSHELRNPLNVMIGNIELLALETVNTKQLQMLNTCKICGEVLLGLINNILDVAKINAHKLEVNYLPGDFYQLVERIWNVSVMKIKQKDLQGTLYIERDFPKYIEMDSHRLTQVLLNLIGNASKFTNQGFVKVFITWHDNENIEDLKKPHPEYLKLVSGSPKTRNIHQNSTEESEMSRIDTIDYLEIQLPRELRISDRFIPNNLLPRPFTECDLYRYLSMPLDETKLPSVECLESITCRRKKNGFMKISVIDTGCGISQVALNRIFLPFEQADSSITRQFGGTGLGLYITHQLVHKMGGQICVYSREDVGTNFSVIIPAQIVSERDVRKKTNEVKPVGNKRELRALVVDDNFQNQLIICSFLMKLNIKSEIANNGKEAVELFKKNGNGYYTLITMDLQMPIMDGLAACRKIRKLEVEHGVDCPTPIIVITGNCTNHEKTECLNPIGDIRANFFYRKPFTYDECKAAVSSIVARGQKLGDKKTRILIVDDDPFNQKVIQDYLLKYGFVCNTCSNGEKALQKLKQDLFNVVLLDCEMPQMDGFTAAKHIKRLHPNVLIIGVTGHTENMYIQKAIESGMKYVETKPIDFQKLLGLISVSFCSSV